MQNADTFRSADFDTSFMIDFKRHLYCLWLNIFYSNMLFTLFLIALQVEVHNVDLLTINSPNVYITFRCVENCIAVQEI